MSSINVEEHIPAFSMWKMLNETVPVLRKSDSSEASIKKLAAIIQSKEGSNIFISHKDPILSFEQFQEIGNCYKAFTTWILGQFFYLLCLDKLEKLHDIIIEAQICILEQLARTQLHIFHDLSEEYYKGFLELVEYYECPNPSSVILKIFLPQNYRYLDDKLNLQQIHVEILTKLQCKSALEKLTKFLKLMLKETFIFYSFGVTSYIVLDKLLLLTTKSEESLRIKIVDIFIGILKHSRCKFYEFKLDIMNRLISFSSFFEQYIYKVYDSQIVLKNDDFIHFESLLFIYLQVAKEWGKLFKSIQRIEHYIFKKQFERDVKILPSYEILLTVNVRIKNTDNIKSDLKIMMAADLNQNALCYHFKTTIFSELIGFEHHTSTIKAFSTEVTSTYSKLYLHLLRNVEQIDCVDICGVDQFLNYFKSFTNMLIEIKLELIKNKEIFSTIQFFDENKLICEFLGKYITHSKMCKSMNCSFENKIANFLNTYILLTNSTNIECISDIFMRTLLGILDIKIDEKEDFICTDWKLKKCFRDFQKYFLSCQNVSSKSLLLYTRNLFIAISSGLVDMRNIQIRNIEMMYKNVCKAILLTQDLDLIFLVIETIPHIASLFEDIDHFIYHVLSQTLLNRNNSIQEKTLEIVPTLLCIINSNFMKLLMWNCDEAKLNVTFFCMKCQQNCLKEGAFSTESFIPEVGIGGVPLGVQKVTMQKSLNDLFLKHCSGHLSGDSKLLKIRTLSSLPSLSNHVEQFHSKKLTQIWVKIAGDSDVEIRKTLTEVIGSVLKYLEINNNISLEVKKENQDVIFKTILNLTKKSLKYSDYNLQYSLINIIDEITRIQSETIILEMMKVLFYFIMVPTSKYSLIAVNKCFTIARRHNTNTSSIYNQNKKEYCAVIAHLCCVNKVLINYSLDTSLEKVSPMFEFHGSKEFLIQESNNLLPYLIAKIVEIPVVTKLVEEVALLIELDLSEMLSRKYGYIFIHIFLENLPSEEFKQCMMYLEKTSGVSGPALRKRNFRIILNELLLNFHEKKDRVLLALALLKEEDSDSRVSSIQEYLQCHFLGVLLYFDVKFFSKTLRKEKFLLSLADFFRYMGPKYIMPLRFKIIAMLQTSNYEKFPALNCEVWDAFIRTCEIESLGPQLALIFVSMLPLLDCCPSKVNKIFKYLIIENEHHFKNYISDLFFVNNEKINYDVDNIIKKYLSGSKEGLLKEKMQKFMRYLTHEAMEVRIQSLKHLKNCLQESREELDKMILDYNGIDSSVVELIDILTLGCREKDKSFKLFCGEVLGELGAVEPSHLPRRYTNDLSQFSFYINEDSFIVSSLNELIKALQTEKNTQCMDRYSLAIQDILKLYGISPSNNSVLWNEFPESQREVMLPLLSSRYMIAQPVLSSNLPTPIYGSNSGASFQSWLYNWTCSLISSLPNDKKSLLKVCLPSMRQDNRILLHFLPHILLHALLEGEDSISEKSFVEIQTITNSFTAQKTLDPKVLNLRPIPLTGASAEPQSVTPEELKQTQCTKVVFLLLDFLDRWLREWHWQKGSDCRSDEHYAVIKNFLGKLSKLQLAKCNYHCGEYPRALLYLEDYMGEHPSEVSDNLYFLSEIYAQLEEPDGVDGASKLQLNEPSVEQRILALEVSGKLADATTCYEQILQPMHLKYIRGLVQCYLDLDNVNTALNFVRGALDKQPDFGNMLLEMQAEPLWRLGQYEELDNLLNMPDLARAKSWGVDVGRALLSFKEGNRNQFQSTLDEMMREQVESFGAATLEEGAYQHGYAYISKLHALNELHQVEKLMHELKLKPNDQQFANSLILKLKNEWSLRLKIVQESVSTIEPLLCLRRVSLNLAKVIAKNKMPEAVRTLDTLIGDCWIQSAKTARAAGMPQQAYTYLIKAEEYTPTTLFLEKAKLHWLREEHEQALTTLRRGLEIIFPDGTSVNGLPLETRKMCAEARLLIASYNDQISNVDVEMNLLHYKKAVDVYKEWEKSMVCLAQYYDKIFQTYSHEERDSKGGDIQLYMINYFGKSLQYGTTYIYQSMPRLLSIWFDYGTRFLEVTDNSVKEERKTLLFRMTKLIDSFLERLPTYVFLTAFSQLVSRICHPQREVYGELKCILIKLLQQYPQQSLWMIISVIKSSYAVRSKRCSEILSDPRLKATALIKLVKDFTSLAEKLIELCNKEIAQDVNTTSVNTLLRSLPRMLSKDDFSEIMMPTNKFRKLILPNPDFNSSQHNPFPNHYVHIIGIEDELTVLTSLQRPRKVTLRGSDGKGYIYMLKPKDDLRKDFRLMEFNDIVNQLLTRDGEARQRRLSIRLYSVAPLNEECGLIEWVPNLIGLRPVLMKLYRQRGLGMKGRELKEACCNIRDSLEKKRETFVKKLIPKHPPVLNDWFRKTFPDAQSWLTGRTAYIRTTAVMSMAGYILGLGDRHGENISLDSTCGDVVHVDFNCLFNKGEKFDWPERVPFRLTHNMVAAMGPLGVEGLFRKSCGITLRVLRENTNTLMSIVAPFVYDPLVSWPRNISALPNVHSAERTNEEAMDHIKNIELRLQGRIKTRHRTSLMPLSVEGQTNYLINEAVSIDNLCQMYIGWGPYL